jgi:hypothetical protein
MLWEFQDYQEEKDHPQAQVINIEIEELSVNPTQSEAVTDHAKTGSINDSSP